MADEPSIQRVSSHPVEHSNSGASDELGNLEAAAQAPAVIPTQSTNGTIAPPAPAQAADNGNDDDDDDFGDFGTADAAPVAPPPAPVAAPPPPAPVVASKPADTILNLQGDAFLTAVQQTWKDLGSGASSDAQPSPDALAALQNTVNTSTAAATAAASSTILRQGGIPLDLSASPGSQPPPGGSAFTGSQQGLHWKGSASEQRLLGTLGLADVAKRAPQQEPSSRAPSAASSRPSGPVRTASLVLAGEAAAASGSLQPCSARQHAAPCLAPASCMAC